MESPQTFAQQREKSQGKAAYEDAIDRITGEHAGLRLDSGFNLEQVVAEYRALRASVLWLWRETNPSNGEQDLEEVIRFNETIDQAIAEVTRRFADKATRYSDRFLGILAHEVRSPLNLINLAAEHLLIDGAREETRTDDASRIFRGVRRIERLVTDLAVLVRHRTDQPLPLTKTNLDLGVICEEALEEAKASHVDVVFEVHRRGDLNGNWGSRTAGRSCFQSSGECRCACFCETGRFEGRRPGAVHHSQGDQPGKPGSCRYAGIDFRAAGTP
jgi:signal transduction histidine kinase